MLSLLLLLSPLLFSAHTTASFTPISDSCSSGSSPSDCTIPPFLNLLQSWDPESTDHGAWLIKALEVESCETGRRLTTCSSSNLNAEQIMSACERSTLFSAGELEKSEGEWMRRSDGEGVEEVWERAWTVSGTCLSTMSPSCEREGGRKVTNGMEVAPFFQLAHRIHNALPVAQILEDADMIPSDDITYSLSELTETLNKATGYNPLLLCVEGNSLNTISWPIALKAGDSRWTPDFKPRSLESLQQSQNRKSNCPQEGIVLHPSLLSIIRRRKPQPSHTWDPIMRPSPRHLTFTATSTAEDTGATAKLGFFNAAKDARHKVKEERDAVVGRKATRDEL